MSALGRAARTHDRRDGPEAALPRTATAAVLLAVSSLAGGCSGPETSGPERPAEAATLSCSVDQTQILDGGVGRDGIPALTDPDLARAGDPTLSFLRPSSLVVGLRVDGRAIAVPENILWYHEIVNFDLPGRSVAVSLCPLTGSFLTFDRSSVEGREFIVSGLLFRNNLIMTFRNGETLFPQMSRGARCGPRRDEFDDLAMYPTILVRWDHWRELHPETEVVSSATGFDRRYTVYPYGDYDTRSNATTLFPISRVDARRPPKERQLGIPSGDGGLAVPFGQLEKAGDAVADSVNVGGDPMFVFWKREARAAMAYRPVAELPGGGIRRLGFRVSGGDIVDRETGSTWTVDGRAVSGPLEGAELRPVPEAYPAFWFSWALFQPGTAIWLGPERIQAPAGGASVAGAVPTTPASARPTG